MVLSVKYTDKKADKQTDRQTDGQSSNRSDTIDLKPEIEEIKRK